MDSTKTRTSCGKTLFSGRTAPTQAKTGLEWATRLEICIVNHHTRDTDIDVVVSEVLDAASEILSEQETK